MSNHHFFGQDGEPTTGQVPVQWFIHGGAAASPEVAEARSHVNAFLLNLRNSTLSQARKKLPLTAGGHVDITHAFGVTRVDVYLRTPKSTEGPFYGGILISPSYIVDESTFFNASVSAASPTTVPVEEVASAGTVSGNGGRAAVPGTATTDITDWLVVQIAKDRPLGSAPIATGAVKIFRIKDPKFGPYVEVRNNRAYLLSAVPAQPSDPDGLREFYLCGKKVSSIPPLVVPDGTLVGVGQLVRLRTYALTFKSFETADQAQGIVIFANGTYLYAYNTTNAGAGWILLHSVPSQSMNDYGTEFRETRVKDVTTITCSGFNGAGACSGFEVVINGAPDGSPVISGTIFPMGDGAVSAGPQTLTFTKTITNNEELVSPRGTVHMASTLDPETEVVEQTFWSGTNSVKTGQIDMHVEGHFKEGTPALIPDKFAGGFEPTYQEIEYTFTYDWSYVTTLYASGLTSDWVPLYPTHPELWVAKPWSAMKYVMTEAATVNYLGSYLGDTNRFTTVEYTNFDGGWERYTPPDDFYGPISGSTYTFSGGLTFDPKARLRYIGSDQHTDRLRFQREEIRTGVITPSWTIEDTLRQGRGYAGGQNTPEGDWFPFQYFLRSIDFRTTPPQMLVRLLRRGGDVAFEWPDVLATGTQYYWQTTNQPYLSEDFVYGVVGFTRDGLGAVGSPIDLLLGTTSAVIGTPEVEAELPAISTIDHAGGPGSAPRAVGLVSYPAQGIFGGYSTWITLNPDDPGNNYDIYGNSMGPPVPTYIVMPPWSMSLTYPGTYPEGVVDYSDLIAILVMSKYATTPFDHTDGAGNYVVPATYTFVMPPFNPNIERGLLKSLTDRTTVNEGIILHDPRSNGFIAQIKSRRVDVPGSSTPHFWHFHDAVIGNDFDTQPLANVLAEWRALGEDSGNSNNKHIFLQTSPTPSLL